MFRDVQRHHYFVQTAKRGALDITEQHTDTRGRFQGCPQFDIGQAAVLYKDRQTGGARRLDPLKVPSSPTAFHLSRLHRNIILSR